MAKTLTVYLAADLKKFNGGMRDAQNSVNGFGGSLKNMLGPALIAAGAAAGAFAIKLGVDGVKAAMEDQAAVAALSTTLDNLNLSHDTQAVEDYIYQLERAYGVADTELRPAYDRLVRSTKNTTEANAALKTAMDISAATGKSLETITDALGRAYDGNTVSLGRLGLGIDKTALATMSLEDIMATLADTFGGQADAQARTFEGQLQRLTTATDNLKEAFGAGLLNALGDTDGQTQDLVDTMEELEPLLQDLGQTAGEFGQDLLYVVGVFTDLKDAIDGATLSLDFLPDGFDTLLNAAKRAINPVQGVLDLVRQLRLESQEASTPLQQTADRLANDMAPAAQQLANTQGQANFQISAANRLYQDAASRAQRLANELDDVEESTGGAARATEKLSKAQKKLLEDYDLAGIAFQTTKRDLIDQIGALEEATKAVEDYATAIQQDLLSGIDLGQLYEDQFDEDGNRTGVSWVQGFNQAIDQAEWFGNVLTALKAKGADQSLIEQLASLGPATGGALGQELLDGPGALLDTLNDKWVGVQEKTRELALGLVPEFLEAGRLSAIDALSGIATQFAEDQLKFKKLGGQLGKQVGTQFKTKMLNEIRDAVREVEAIATAARAEAVAAAQAEQARITQQAVANAIAGIIRDSDQRSGRNVQPVLQ